MGVPLGSVPLATTTIRPPATCQFINVKFAARDPSACGLPPATGTRWNEQTWSDLRDVEKPAVNRESPRD